MDSTEGMIIGTRGSALALWQSRHVANLLNKAGITSELEIIVTKGDVRLDKPLPELGDKGLFTAELDQALLHGRIDLAVHSLKDLPTDLPEGLAMVAITERAEPWDVLVARDPELKQIEDLPHGAVIGTSSLRRASQIQGWRSDIQVVSVRGNVGTRIKKVESEGLQGVILAEAGLRRLGLENHIAVRFSPDVILPAVGQGALGVVAAVDRRDVADIAHSELNHEPSRIAVTAERALLRRLEGGCQVPVGALARLDTDGRLHIDGFVGSLDGSTMLRESLSGLSDNPESLGLELAERLLDRGAGGILSAIREADSGP